MEQELTAQGLAAVTVTQAAAGDAAAFADIVAAYHDDMARVCFLICGSPSVSSSPE